MHLRSLASQGSMVFKKGVQEVCKIFSLVLGGCQIVAIQWLAVDDIVSFETDLEQIIISAQTMYITFVFLS